MEKFLQFLQSLERQLFDEGALQALIAMGIIVLLAMIAIYLTGRICDRLDKNEKYRRFSFGFLRHVVKIILITLAIIGILYQIKPFRSMTTSLLAGSGIVAVFIGIASQEAMSNMVGGMLLSVNKPFVTGDRITLSSENLTGFVEEVTLRHTVLRTFENTRVIVPNSKINNSILENVNFVDNITCNFLDVSVGYEADLDQAISIVSRVVAGHTLCMDRRSEEERRMGSPVAAVRVVGFTPYGCDLRCSFWTKDAGDGYTVMCDARLEIKKQFDARGIAWPYMTNILHNERA